MKQNGETKTIPSKENWQAMRARYRWHLLPPFKDEFDRTHWWKGLFGLFFIVLGCLVWKFSKSKPLKPLKISCAPLEKPFGLKSVFQIIVCNETIKSVTNLEIRLLKIEPPLKHRTLAYTTESLHIPAMIFPAKDFQNRKLKPGQSGCFDIFTTKRSASETEMILGFCGEIPNDKNWESWPNEFLPDIVSENGMRPVFGEHTFTIEATAKELLKKEIQFRILFLIDNEKPHFEIKEIKSV